MERFFFCLVEDGLLKFNCWGALFFSSYNCLRTNVIKTKRNFFPVVNGRSLWKDEV